MTYHPKNPRFLIMLAASAAMLATALPASAQDNLGEARIRKLEAQVRAMQGKVFPSGAGIAPESSPAPIISGSSAATTPATDMLTRMDSLEAQVTRLTAQSEENGNRLRKLEARLPATPATPATAAAAAPSVVVPETGTATNANLSAITGGASDKPSAHRTVASDAKPSASRLAAVHAITKPKSDDPIEDDYTYAYRLWEGKLYPEAEQQLKAFIDKHPKHDRISYARNLMGRSFLDDGKPREAASWFLQNYQSNKTGDRAPDSLLLLAESMSQLKDTSRACIALSEFAATYPKEAAGRLKAQYGRTRSGVKCN